MISPLSPDLVVVGAGPAGLCTALAASCQGVENILVLESRDGNPRRNNVLLLDDSILAALRQLGVDAAAFTPATSFTFIDGDAGVRFRFPLGCAGRGSGKSSVLRMFPRRSPAADVLISELEQALLAALAKRPGIRILPHVSITSIQKISTGRRIEFEQQGSASCLETPLLAVCDGARSSTLQLLGIGRRGNRRQEVALVANFLQPGRGQVKFQRCEPLEEVLALCSDRGSTVTVRLPQDAEIADYAEPSRRCGLMRQQAAKLGIGGDFITPPSVVEISHDRATRCSLDNDVFVLGDAARTATPRLGLGANWAMQDALRLARLLPAIRSSSPLRRSWACWNFRWRTRLATQVLLLQGWLLQRSDRGSTKAMPAGWRFRQKSLLMRFMWRAGRGEVHPARPSSRPVAG